MDHVPCWSLTNCLARTDRAIFSWEKCHRSLFFFNPPIHTRYIIFFIFFSLIPFLLISCGRWVSVAISCSMLDQRFLMQCLNYSISEARWLNNSEISMITVKVNELYLPRTYPNMRDYTMLGNSRRYYMI